MGFNILTLGASKKYTEKTIIGEGAIRGKDGTDGKSAYQYATDGGYTGTEEEFAKKLAKEIEVDSDLSEESENPIQNKVVAKALNDVKTTVGNVDALLETI